jgi:hypothetical protein
MLVARVRDVPARDLARDERAFKPNPEPFAEFAMVGKRAPDARDGGFQLDGFFDAIGHAQPPGCA